MNRQLIALLVCSFYGMCVEAGTRNMVMALDFDRESLREEFKNSKYAFNAHEYGPVTQTLIAALYQQAAPILVSSSTWRNAIERGKAYEIAQKGGDLGFLKRYTAFSNTDNINKFVNDLRYGYDINNDLLRASTSIISAEYYQAYQVFFSKDPVFKPKEWITKKVSDYLYLLIPRKYLQQLEQSKDTPDLARKTVTPLSPSERVLGIKYGKLANLSANALLDVNAHPDVINAAQYNQLLPAHSHGIAQRLLGYKWLHILNGFMFGQHVVNILPTIFVTHTDLKFPGGDRIETDLNEAYFMHEWLVYLIGHGSQSGQNALAAVVEDFGGGAQAVIGFTAGIDQGAFRDMLSFFNNRVNTGALVYTSCYSGGHHLFKLFEHHWDYPKRQGVGKKAKITKENVLRPDTFNFLIVATNMFYTVTTTSIFAFWSDAKYYSRNGQATLNLTSFFKQMAQFLGSQPIIKAPQQVKGKKKVLSAHPGVEQQLATVLQNVTQFDTAKNYQVPAVRFPYTQWFVPLTDAGQEIRFESDTQKNARLQEDMRAKALLLALAKKKELPPKVKQSIETYAKAHGLPVPFQPKPAQPAAPTKQPIQPAKQQPQPAQPLKPAQPNVPVKQPVKQPVQQPVKPPVQPKPPVQQKPPVQPPVKPAQPVVPPQVQSQVPQPPAQKSPLAQALNRLESALYSVITELLK